MFLEDESKTETGLIYFIENMFFDFLFHHLLPFYFTSSADMLENWPTMAECRGVCVGLLKKTLLILGRHLFILVKLHSLHRCICRHSLQAPPPLMVY